MSSCTRNIKFRTPAENRAHQSGIVCSGDDAPKPCHECQTSIDKRALSATVWTRNSCIQKGRPGPFRPAQYAPERQRDKSSQKHVPERLPYLPANILWLQKHSSPGQCSLMHSRQVRGQQHFQIAPTLVNCSQYHNQLPIFQVGNRRKPFPL